MGLASRILSLPASIGLMKAQSSMKKCAPVLTEYNRQILEMNEKA